MDRILPMSTPKGEAIKTNTHIPKSTLKLVQTTEDQFFAEWDAAVERFGFSSRGDLLVHLFSKNGDIEIVSRKRKR
jgi:hypothetical protein